MSQVFRLPLRFSERRLILILLDLFALNGGLLVSLSLRPEYRLTWMIVFQYPQWFLLISLLWLFIGFAFDVYDLKVAGRFSTASRAIVKAGLITGGIYLLISYLLSGSRLALLFLPILVSGLLLAGRVLYILFLSQPLFNRRALIIGAGPSAQEIARAVSEHTNAIYNVTGFVEDTVGVNNPHPSIESSDVKQMEDLSLQLLGDRETLLDLIKQNQVETLILATDQKVDGKLLQTLSDSLEVGVEIIPMPLLYEELTGRVPVEHIGESWQVAMPFDHPLTKPYNLFIKRISDVILASLGCLFLSPFFPFIALAIYVESHGHIFYKQARVGRGGGIFKAYKFRSMVPDAEKGQAVWAEKNDPRVTRVGRLLRKTHLDEFPQFINILKGEMSAVGPRPERPEFIEELAKEIPFYKVRHAVKPGMAGWGLVKQGYGASKEDAFLKLQYDLYYIKHQSFFFDLVILLKTVIDTITFRGRA
ncbi:MAG: sugar transferase [Deltaproteobacteria bacterium]|nr:sugar transferase [Deltaproteobacteria bacterium]